MIFATEQDVVDYVKANKSPAQWVKDAREYSTTLCALVNGENFKDLVEKIEHIETQAKAIARKKYARSLKGYFSRIFLPIENVFAATGGVKDYENGETKLSTDAMKRLLSIVSSVRDGKSIERYIEEHWLNLYHTDPAGVLWMRYKTDMNGVVESCYPTYQAIGGIRHYVPKGQMVECILYEPKSDGQKQLWTVVDDKYEYLVIQQGDFYVVSTDPNQTFEHPFGTVPVLINSGITDKFGARKSPIDDIIDVSKEYARDLSVKTIYKFLHGFPKSWMLDMLCGNCNGTKRSGDKPCVDCNATGWRSGKSDVTDVARLPFPKDATDPLVKGADIMGYSSPDLETWGKFTEELKFLECEAFETLWGVSPETEVRKTATEVFQDQQPKINKLNKYANAAEWIEWMMTEWIANCVDLTKPKNKPVSLIVYGRRYILEGVDTIQKKYEEAKAAGENTVVLDGIFDELLTVKFKNDPEWMRTELKKAACEPYLHQSVAEINNIFGAKEAARKIYFQEWWKSRNDSDILLDTKVLKNNFAADFKLYLPTLDIVEPLNKPLTAQQPEK